MTHHPSNSGFKTASNRHSTNKGNDKGVAMQRTGGLPRKGLLLAIGAAMLLGVLYLSTGASLTRAQQHRRGLIESSAGDQSTPIVASKARPGVRARVGALKEAACSAVSKRHKTFEPLLAAGLCKRLSSLSQASKYLHCRAPVFALEGTQRQRPIGTACQPHRDLPDVANGTAINLPCKSHGCCDAPVTLRKGTRDCGVFQQVFAHHFYKYIYPIAQTFSPKYILDAGGNVGFSTVMFKLLWPEAIVVGLEPDPANFASYQLNTAPFRDVHAVNAGLWSHRTRLAPAQENMESWGKVFKEVGLDEEGIDAYSVKDIAVMFNIPGFDFVKMDVEGAEGVVFMGDKDLSWLQDVQLMALEVHEGGNSPFGLREVTPQVLKALFNTGMRGVEDGEHVFFMTQELQHRVEAAPGSD